MGETTEVRLTVVQADRFFFSLRRLMFKPSFGVSDGVLLPHCKSVHTYLMRFDIDVIFLDRNLRVVGLCEHVKPNRLGVCCPQADAVLECPAGFIAKSHLTSNHVLELIPNPGPPSRTLSAYFRKGTANGN